MLNIRQLREVLSSVIEALQEDKTTSSKANAITNACGKILSSVKLEMEYCQIIGKAEKIPFLELDYKPEEVAPAA